ncbi:hypothetical protein [Thioalkalivibrio paradoxus]|nr:hypothetical protein [Thioalkalivibrio paradoxus]
MAIAATSAAGAPRQLHSDPGALGAVAAELADAPPAARLDFAVLVVDALIGAYEAELERALQDRSRSADAQRRLESWRQATAGYVRELRIAQAALYVAQWVEVYLDRHDRIVLLIDDRPFWVAWPRVDAGLQLEPQLAEEFCRRHVCGTAAQTASSQARRGASLTGSWVLTQNRPPAWATVDGLRCEFGDLSDRPAKEALCRAVAADLQQLGAALRASVGRSDTIQWEYLTLQSDAVSGRHWVTVNADGDHLLLSLPALAEAPIDWGEVVRWLRGQIAGRAVDATVVRPANFSGGMRRRPRALRRIRVPGDPGGNDRCTAWWLDGAVSRVRAAGGPREGSVVSRR